MCNVAKDSHSCRHIMHNHTWPPVRTCCNVPMRVSHQWLLLGTSELELSDAHFSPYHPKKSKYMDIGRPQNDTNLNTQSSKNGHTEQGANIKRNQRYPATLQRSCQNLSLMLQITYYIITTFLSTNSFFLQKQGAQMGANFSPSLANLYVS